LLGIGGPSVVVDLGIVRIPGDGPVVVGDGPLIVG